MQPVKKLQFTSVRGLLCAQGLPDDVDCHFQDEGNLRLTFTVLPKVPSYYAAQLAGGWPPGCTAYPLPLPAALGPFPRQYSHFTTVPRPGALRSGVQELPGAARARVAQPLRAGIPGCAGAPVRLAPQRSTSLAFFIRWLALTRPVSSH